MLFVETCIKENNFLDLQGVFLRFLYFPVFRQSFWKEKKKKKKETRFFFSPILMQLDALGALTWVSQIFAPKADRCVFVRDAEPLSP